MRHLLQCASFSPESISMDFVYLLLFALCAARALRQRMATRQG